MRRGSEWERGARRTVDPVGEGLSLEVALASLRKGNVIRRTAWHPASYLFAVNGDVFVKLPNNFQRAPVVWAPYPQDMLALDWVVMSRGGPRR